MPDVGPCGVRSTYMHPILLLSGPPSSGKSTIGRRLAEELPLSMHLEVDELRHFVVGGLALPSREDRWPQGVDDQFSWARQGAIHMARLYARQGVAVIVDDVCVPRAFPEHYADLGAGRDVRRVLLLPTARALYGRLERRGGEYDEAIVHHVPWIYEQVEQMDLSAWTVLDPGEGTVEETVEAVRAAWRSGG